MSTPSFPIPRILLLGALVAIPIGCAARHVEPYGAGVIARSDRTGWYIKKVVAKDPPDALLADDGTICRVAPDRFRTTTVGTAMRCNWQ